MAAVNRGMRTIAASMIVWMTSVLRLSGRKLAVRTGVKDVDALFMRFRALRRFASWIGDADIIVGPVRFG